MQALAAAGPIMQLAGSAMGTISNVMATDVQAKGLDAQARSVEQDTQAQVNQQQRQVKLQSGTNNATMAATGLDITRGSSLLDQLDFAKQAEIEKQSIQRSGTIAANNLRFDARMTRRQIPFQIAQGVMQGASILTRLAGPPARSGGG